MYQSGFLIDFYFVTSKQTNKQLFAFCSGTQTTKENSFFLTTFHSFLHPFFLWRGSRCSSYRTNRNTTQFSVT